MNFKHVLVTTDFSKESFEAFDYASYQAKMDGIKVTLLAIVEDWEVPAMMIEEIGNPEGLNEYRKELLAKAETKLSELAKTRFHGQKVETKAILSSNPVAIEITNFAEKNSVDLIVMSRHGSSALSQLLLGSVVNKVLQLAKCPVMIVPKSSSAS